MRSIQDHQDQDLETSADAATRAEEAKSLKLALEETRSVLVQKEQELKDKNEQLRKCSAGTEAQALLAGQLSSQAPATPAGASTRHNKDGPRAGGEAHCTPNLSSGASRVKRAASLWEGRRSGGDDMGRTAHDDAYGDSSARNSREHDVAARFESAGDVVVSPAQLMLASMHSRKDWDQTLFEREESPDVNADAAGGGDGGDSSGGADGNDAREGDGMGWAAREAAAEEVAEVLAAQLRELKEARASTQDALAAKTRELDAQGGEMTRLRRLEAEARAGERQVRGHCVHNGGLRCTCRFISTWCTMGSRAHAHAHTHLPTHPPIHTSTHIHTCTPIHLVHVRSDIAGTEGGTGGKRRLETQAGCAEQRAQNLATVAQ